METYKAPPPDDMPSDTICVVLRVPNSPKWLSSFWWILDQYNYWFNWESTADKRGKLVAWRWREMFWQARRENPAGQDCEQLTVSGLGIDLGEDISMQIRISPDDSCIIQMWCIDHWENWYDPRACIAAGASQASPGGELDPDECVTYNVTLRGNERYLLPVPVQEGYEVQISGASGGWWDGNLLHAWNCPNGQTYALGVCASTGASDPSSPIPSLPIGRLIAQIDSEYFDAYNQTITVPPGTASTDLYFQMNDDTLTDNQGSVSFTVRICATSVATWSKQWNFAEGAMLWTAYNCAGDCGNGCNAGLAGTYDGSEWDGTLFGCSGQLFLVISSPVWPDDGYVTSIRVRGNSPNAIPLDGFGSGLSVAVKQGASFVPMTTVAVPSGAFDITIPVNEANVTQIRVGINDQTGATPSVNVDIVDVNGSGANPFV